MDIFYVEQHLCCVYMDNVQIVVHIGAKNYIRVHSALRLRALQLVLLQPVNHCK